MRNAGLGETQVGIKIPGRNINNLRYADDTILMAESEELLKSFLMKVREERKNVNYGFWFHHFMENRWGKVETGAYFYFPVLQNHCKQ